MRYAELLMETTVRLTDLYDERDKYIDLAEYSDDA
jgi:hypothetical protein